MLMLSLSFDMSLGSALTLVVQPHDACRICIRRHQAELRVHVVREDTLAASQRQRVQKKMQLVDQVVLEQRVDELAAAIREDVLARLRFESAYRLDHVVTD